MKDDELKAVNKRVLQDITGMPVKVIAVLAKLATKELVPKEKTGLPQKRQQYQQLLLNFHLRCLKVSLSLGVFICVLIFSIHSCFVGSSDRIEGSGPERHR